MAEPPIHFLLHVPKCAGTTVEAHFARHLGPAFRIAPRWEHVARNIIGNRYPKLDLAGVRAISGHSLSVSLKAKISGEVRESVLLRAPLGFFLSFYNYRWTRFEEGWGPEPPSFARWYFAQRRNPISRFLLNRYFEQGVPALYRLSSAGRLAWLEDRLAGFHFVGGHTRADEMIAGLSREMGLPEAARAENVTQRKKLRASDLPEALVARIARENALDQALFDRWATRGWAGRADAPMPALRRWDQPRYLLGDSVSAIAKKAVG